MSKLFKIAFMVTNLARRLKPGQIDNSASAHPAVAVTGLWGYYIVRYSVFEFLPKESGAAVECHWHSSYISNHSPVTSELAQMTTHTRRYMAW